MTRILVVDDEQSMRDFLTIFLRKEGYDVRVAEDGQKALLALSAEEVDLVISDVRMSQMDGMRLLREVKGRYPNVEVIVMTAFSSTADAIGAMKDGAYDYITKPFKLDEVAAIIRRALEARRIKTECQDLRQALKGAARIQSIVGTSPAMTRVYELIRKVADTRTTVLITGESGTGKELVARALHFNSRRDAQPFITINCGAIPAELMESEIFGHVKGSFTGAVRDKEGLFVAAGGGTLFLDEVGELPLALQVKLLRALQERRITPIGGTSEIEVDTRVIAATNRDMAAEVRAGRFREDLFYRLNVIQIALPPLRERRDDIPLLVKHFVERACHEAQRPVISVSEAAMLILLAHDYPGNVRELGNLIERAVTLESAEQIRPHSLPRALLERYVAEPVEAAPKAPERLDFSHPQDLDELLAAQERRYLEQALEHAHGNKTEAAKLLGLTLRSMRYRLIKLGLETQAEGEDVS